MPIDWNWKTGIIPFPEKLPPVEPGVEPKAYCCKKWVAGELKKYYSRGPCSGGAVMCSDADPPKPVLPGEGGGQSCEEKCEEAYGQERGEYGRRGPGRKERQLQQCLERCRGGPGKPPPPPPPPPPGVFCRGGHKRTEPACGDGFIMREDPETGIDWCCPEGPPPPPPPPGGDPCLYGPGYQNIEGVNLPCDPGWHSKLNEEGEEFCCPDEKKGAQGPCSGEGHELPFGTSLCEEGFSIRKADDGTFWCCKDKKGGGNGEDCDPGWHWDEDLERCARDGPDSCPTGTHWDEYTEECVDDENGNGNGGGEFKWGEGLQGLLARIQERANYLLDYPRGLSPSERQGVINYAIESVKSGERGAIQSKRDQLARSGLLGSGFEFDEIGKIQRETRASQTQIRRELAIDDLDRRFSELMGTTGMAQGLTGTLMQGEQIPEILSGARRSEGQASMNQLLALLGGSAQGQGNQYWGLLLQKLMGQQGGQTGGIWDWLPWLLANRTGTRAPV